MDMDKHAKAIQVRYNPRPAASCRLSCIDVFSRVMFKWLNSWAFWMIAVQTATPERRKILPKIAKTAEEKNVITCFTTPLGQNDNQFHYNVGREDEPTRTRPTQYISNQEVSDNTLISIASQ
jgi:hypothetical protein